MHLLKLQESSRVGRGTTFAIEAQGRGGLISSGFSALDSILPSFGFQISHVYEWCGVHDISSIPHYLQSRAIIASVLTKLSYAESLYSLCRDSSKIVDVFERQKITQEFIVDSEACLKNNNIDFFSKPIAAWVGKDIAPSAVSFCWGENICLSAIATPIIIEPTSNTSSLWSAMQLLANPNCSSLVVDTRGWSFVQRKSLSLAARKSQALVFSLRRIEVQPCSILQLKCHQDGGGWQVELLKGIGVRQGASAQVICK